MNFVEWANFDFDGLRFLILKIVLDFHFDDFKYGFD